MEIVISIKILNLKKSLRRLATLMVIYPGDSIIHLLNNWGLVIKYAKQES